MYEHPGNESRTFPLSCQIIGTIVEALNIKNEDLTDKTAKRFYADKIVSPHSLKKIYTTLGKQLVDLGIVPIPPLFKQYDVSMENIITVSLARLASKWDTLCADIKSSCGKIQDYDQAFYGMCRLVVVDLALRIVAWLRLAKQSPPDQGTPLWAVEEGAGKMLRKLLSEAGITREQFSARVGVSHISIDNWFDSKIRPTPENIEILVNMFSELIHDLPEDVLRVQLQRQFTMAYLADKLADNIGRDKVIELATALYRFTWLISKDINSMDRPPIEKVCGLEFQTLRYGTDEQYSHDLLRNIAIIEKDPQWKKDILAATVDWVLRFEEIGTQSSSPKMAAGLAQELPENARQKDIESGAAADLLQLRDSSELHGSDYLSITSGNIKGIIELLNKGIEDRRSIVQHYPLSSQAHLELGAYLGMIGKHYHDMERIKEGINECKIAASLCQGWDNPLVEPGIILINIGMYDKALTEFESALEKLAEITPHFTINRGYALMQTGQYEKAFNDFKFVIDTRPDYGPALDFAAHSAFMINDTKIGIRYAKEARKYGNPRTYNNWRSGLYKTKIHANN